MSTQDQSTEKQNQDGNNQNAGNDFVTKTELNDFKQMFSQFTDVVSEFIDESNKDRRVTVNANQNTSTMNTGKTDEETKTYISKEEAEEHGFDEKQVKFMNSFVSKVARETATAVSRETVSSYDSVKTISQETAEMDQEAYTRFPDLKNPQSALYKKTAQIMERQRKIEKDPDKNRPDFILSAAFRAKAMLEDEEKQKNIPQNQYQEPRRNRFQLEVSSTSSGIKREEKPEQLSQERQALRRAFGVSK